MSEDDIPTVDPDNRKGKLEIAWMAAIAAVVLVLAFIIYAGSSKRAPVENGIFAPGPPPGAAPKKPAVPAH